MSIRINIDFFPYTLEEYAIWSFQPCVDYLFIATHSLRILAGGSLSLTNISPVINLEHFSIHREDASNELSPELLKHLVSNDFRLYSRLSTHNDGHTRLFLLLVIPPLL